LSKFKFLYLVDCKKYEADFSIQPVSLKSSNFSLQSHVKTIGYSNSKSYAMEFFILNLILIFRVVFKCLWGTPKASRASWCWSINSIVHRNTIKENKKNGHNKIFKNCKFPRNFFLWIHLKEHFIQGFWFVRTADNSRWYWDRGLWCWFVITNMLLMKIY